MAYTPRCCLGPSRPRTPPLSPQVPGVWKCHSQTRRMLSWANSCRWLTLSLSRAKPRGRLAPQLLVEVRGRVDCVLAVSWGVVFFSQGFTGSELVELFNRSVAVAASAVVQHTLFPLGFFVCLVSVHSIFIFPKPLPQTLDTLIAGCLGFSTSPCWIRGLLVGSEGSLLDPGRS